MIIRAVLMALFVAGLLLGDEWFPVQIEAPQYPILGLQSGTQGTVLLRVFLKVDGTIASIDIVSGTPLLAQAAQSNLKLWRFQRRGDHERTQSTIDFTYVFKLDGQAGTCPKTNFKYEHPFRAIVSSHALHWMPSSAAKAARNIIDENR